MTYGGMIWLLRLDRRSTRLSRGRRDSSGSRAAWGSTLIFCTTHICPL
ncbi:hypothetical protein E2C01_077871 [Portunus trituberculatus]|uniref:Uncharacterized protein n=1 Tax=Portunus trituberculatus TaxID=210409 RepID=A0A5B7IL96_PORTR|nr:hypothetical protein [Portunus trituberculatus]